MAKKFRGPEIVKDIDDALDKGLKRFLVNTQSKLATASPIDSGRLASSWMIGRGVPNRATRPANWAKPGDKKRVIEPYDGQVRMTSDWFISNSVPYIEQAAFDPGYVGRRGGAAGDWFRRIENNLTKDAKRSFDYFLKKVK